MILIGQFDSPFVRRTAIVMHHHNLAYQRRVLSVFTDFEAMLLENPLAKVPALELDDGEKLFDSRMIIDFLEHSVPAGNRLVPEETEQRWRVLRIEAVALGLAEKSYERGIEYARRAPDKVDHDWARERHWRQELRRERAQWPWSRIVL